MSSVISIAAICLSFAAIVLLWTAWRSRSGRRGPFIVSLAAWCLAFVCWTQAFGVEIGVPLALECAAIMAFAFILTRIEFREPRSVPQRSVPQLPYVRYRWLRGVARVMGAGPIAFAASVGVGILLATTAPLDDATRLILAGLLIPSLWGAAMIWTLASRRILIPSAGLIAIAVMTIGTSIVVAR